MPTPFQNETIVILYYHYGELVTFPSRVIREYCLGPAEKCADLDYLNSLGSECLESSRFCTSRSFTMSSLFRKDIGER